MNTYQHQYTAPTGFDVSGNPQLTVVHNLGKRWPHVTVWMGGPPNPGSLPSEGTVDLIDENTILLRQTLPLDSSGNFIRPLHVRVSA
jgi:hypothetical protein